MSLRLYGYWRSSATYRVRIALYLKQLDFEYIPVNLVRGEEQQRSEDYSGLNPNQLVPTFFDDDEDIILNQSLSIIEYLDEKYDSGPQLIPPYKVERARVRAMAQDIACDAQPITNLRVLTYLRHELAQPREAIDKWAIHWIKKTFDAIEKRLSTTAGEYCFGFDLSLADVVLVPQVYNANRFGLDMQAYPLITQIVENCNSLEAFIKAMPENQTDAPQ